MTQEEPVDHLALASEWAMEVDDWVRNARYEQKVDEDPEWKPGETNQRHIAYMMEMARLHAIVAHAQLAGRGNQTINVSVPGGSVEAEGGVRGVAAPGEGA